MSFRSVGKVIDWFGLRLILLLAIGLTAYSVLQPLIWSELLHRKLPAVSSDLASLMGIVVTIMALVLAIFGVTAYQLVDRKSQASLETRASELQTGLQGYAGNATAKLQTDIEALANTVNAKILLDSATAGAKLFISLSVQSFLSYDDLWRAENYLPGSLTTNIELARWLKNAISNAKTALDQFRGLPEPLQKERDSLRGILISSGNYTYFLATRGLIEDKQEVLEMANELDRTGTNKRRLETVAWAYLRYSAPGEELWNTGLSKLASLMRRSDLDSTDKDTLCLRYKGMFTENGIVLDGIDNALNGQDPPPVTA